MPLYNLGNTAAIAQTTAGFVNSYSDFLAAATTPPWIITAVSAGTASGGVGTATHPGTIRLTSTTTTNSGCRLQTNITGLVLAGGESTDIIFNVPITTTSLSYLGFQNSSTNTAPTDGVYVTINATTLSGNASNNSVSTATGSTFTITQAAWYRMNITVNSTSLATFKLYDATGALVWTNTVTTNIPTARTTGHGVTSTNSGTTAVAICEVDYMSLIINRTLVR